MYVYFEQFKHKATKQELIDHVEGMKKKCSLHSDNRGRHGHPEVCLTCVHNANYNDALNDMIKWIRG